MNDDEEEEHSSGDIAQQNIRLAPPSAVITPGTSSVSADLHLPHITSGATTDALPSTSAMDTDGWSTAKRKRRVSDHTSPSPSPCQGPSSGKFFPPIVFAVPANWNSISKSISCWLKSPSEIILRGGNYHLKCSSAEDYASAKLFLRNQGIAFHSFSSKEDTDVKVVVKGLHHSTDCSAILEALQELGFNATFCRSLKGRNSHLLDMFLVQLPRSSNFSKIYQLSSLLFVKVTVEAFRPRPGKVAQCFRCQRYGHSSINCSHPQRCVKCAGEHHASACPLKITPQSAASCCNCTGPHTANYGGCPAHKKALLIKKQQAQQALKSGGTPSTAKSVLPSQGKTLVLAPTPTPSGNTVAPATSAQVLKKGARVSAPAQQKQPQKNPPPPHNIQNFPPLPRTESLPLSPILDKAAYLKHKNPNPSSPKSDVRRPQPNSQQDGAGSALASLLVNPAFLQWVNNTLPLLLKATSVSELITVLLPTLPALLSCF
jgi:hypothetical protein